MSLDVDWSVEVRDGDGVRRCGICELDMMHVPGMDVGAIWICSSVLSNTDGRWQMRPLLGGPGTHLASRRPKDLNSNVDVPSKVSCWIPKMMDRQDGF